MGLFRAQLEYLTRHFDLVRASDLVEAASARRRGGRIPLAVTFDDDVLCHHAISAPTLAALGVPATFFVGGCFLEADHWYWWELVDALGRCGLSARAIAEAAGFRDPRSIHDVQALGLAVERLSPAQRDAAGARLHARLGEPPPRTRLRATHLRNLARSGHEIGFHTVRHDPLTALDDTGLATALDAGRDAVEAAVGVAPKTIAYPHGKADGRVSRAARDAGWASAFTTVPTTITPQSDRWRLGRVDAPFTTVAELGVRLAALVLSRR
jgi:peptidoglycan/xylan/chitin deacetylase (PgdA/CDA1 family)